MKKLLFMAVPLAVLSGIANAAVPLCSTGNYLGVAGNWSLAQLAGAGCEQGDKIFSNFTGSTQDVSDAFNFFNSGALQTNILLSAGTEGAFSIGFNFGYKITVDGTIVQPLGKTASIANYTGNIGDSTIGSASTLTKTNNVTGCSLVVTDSGAGNVNSTAPCVFPLGTTSLTMAEAFAYTGAVGGSGVTTLQNTFQQVLSTPATTGSPEPMSMLLFGSGLVALAFVRRKAIARK